MPAVNAELAAIAAALMTARRRDEQTLESTFSALKRADPELAKALVETFGDSDLGLRWLLQNPSSREAAPCDLLAKGDREAVLLWLKMIDYGVYF